MKKHILGFGNNVEVRPTTKYIAFRRNKGFEGFVILKNALKIYLNIKKSALEDSLGKARNVEKVEHYPLGDTEIIVSDENDKLFFKTYCPVVQNKLITLNAIYFYSIEMILLLFFFVFQYVRTVSRIHVHCYL